MMCGGRLKKEIKLFRGGIIMMGGRLDSMMKGGDGGIGVMEW